VRAKALTAAQAIQYLSAEFQPSRRQSDDGVARLARGLAPFALTKAEKLQIVNLAPTEPVELYVVRITSPRLRARHPVRRTPILRILLPHLLSSPELLLLFPRHPLLSLACVH
jgi:hypothetical protein